MAVNPNMIEGLLSIDDAINAAIINVSLGPLPREEQPVAVPRKVRIFRDPKKSPNWYVEWRDLEGHRHCESCGPQRRDAEDRAGLITEELRVNREEAKRSAHPAGQKGADDADASAGASGCHGSAVQLQGMLRCGQVEVPITLWLEVTPQFLIAIRQLLRDADPK
jgi:hypothetical protein